MVSDSRADGVLRSLLLSVSQADAARANGVSARTVANWLARGRSDPDGRFGDFARQVDERRAQRYSRSLADALVMDRDELHRVVSEAARNGSIPAMKLLWEMLRADTEDEPEPDSFSQFDGIVPRSGEQFSPYRLGH